MQMLGGRGGEGGGQNQGNNQNQGGGQNQGGQPPMAEPDFDFDDDIPF